MTTLYSNYSRYISDNSNDIYSSNDIYNNSNINDTDAAAANITNITAMIAEEIKVPEEEHTHDANFTLILNVVLIGCLLIAYYVKYYKIYYLPESAGTMLVGTFIGGIVRLSKVNLELFKFSPEVFFFILLPPIIFEAGYSLKRKHFFDNIGAIFLYAMMGTIISTFVVGLLSFYSAKLHLINDVDHENPMEALLFGALISAVDPVATLSIMGNPELQCNQLLYSLVFGESVLNDAIAVVLFKTFKVYYNPEGPNWSQSQIPSALLAFCSMTTFSICLGIGMGLIASFIYKHTSLNDFPKLETSILFCFCYLCYSTAEAVGLSGIMALFFNGIVLSHYNSYNLSQTAQVASEQIFATLATIMETIVFLYMGMGVFTGRFHNWDVLFSVLALTFCLLGRAINIFPLSFIANLCRTTQTQISKKMQCVLWFAGLRGAIAYALAENFPGPNKETYATATLSICFFTTVVCGGFTEPILNKFNMKNDGDDEGTTSSVSRRRRRRRHRQRESKNGTNNNTSLTHNGNSDDSSDDNDSYTDYLENYPTAQRSYIGLKGVWKHIDDVYLKSYFGGSNQLQSLGHHLPDDIEDHQRRGTYENVNAIDSLDHDDEDLDVIENLDDNDNHSHHHHHHHQQQHIEMSSSVAKK